jgi:hypothetical protein
MRSYSTPEIVLIVFSVGIGLYVVFIGYVLARLWYYSGDLGPQPKRYIILPQYLKELLIKEAEEAAARKRAEGDDNKSEVYDGSTVITTTLPTSTTETFSSTLNTPAALRASRWRGTMYFDPNIDLDDLPGRPDERVKAQLREQRRISRIPHFIQDDCGDGRHFPDVPAINPNDPNDPVLLEQLREEREARTPGFRKDPGKYMTMGLKKLEWSQWLVVDDTYLQFHAARTRLLARKKVEAIQVVAEREAEEACAELLREVVAFLTTMYPEHFQLVKSGLGVKVVRNGFTGEEFRVQQPWEMHPLEMCARLALEDFNLLMKSEFTGEHRL